MTPDISDDLDIGDDASVCMGRDRMGTRPPKLAGHALAAALGMIR
jgi:hypothetical protein